MTSHRSGRHYKENTKRQTNWIAAGGPSGRLGQFFILVWTILIIWNIGWTHNNKNPNR